MRALLAVTVAACASAGPGMALAPDALLPTDAPAALDAAPAPLPDAAADAAPEPPGPCFVTRLLGNLCLARAPSGPLVLTSALDTDRDCTEVRAQAGGPDLCVRAGTTIDVRAGAAVLVTGSRPLVLVATGRIAIAGELAVRSVTGMRGTVPCAPANCEGFRSGTPTFNRAGGGGGAGGTFGARGDLPPGIGRGGGGGGNPTFGAPNFGAGTAFFSDVPAQLVGGCTGGRGGGEPGADGGAPGAGGGAVYLVSSVELAVLATGRIVASGDDGGAGRGPGPNLNGGGGGGGGSGGAIALDAPMVTALGALVVDGGSGASGAPAVSSSAGGGSLAPGGGGRGCIGGVEATAGGAGAASPCGSGCTGAGGGGGGGGAGLVLVFAGPT